MTTNTPPVEDGVVENAEALETELLISDEALEVTDTNEDISNEEEESFLEMSDEEFMAQGGAAGIAVEHLENEDKGEVSTTNFDENLNLVEDDENTSLEGEQEEDKFKADLPDGEDDLEKLEEDSLKDPDDKPNYENDWKELFETPIKANGREHKIASVEDAKKLISKGLGYNAAIADLKPTRKIQKMLQNAELLDEQEVSYLIDLKKGDKTAISKLLKDNGIDPVETDWDESAEYEANTENTVTDEELALEEALGTIRGTPSFQSTIALVTKEWDVQSRKELYFKPEKIVQINGAKQSGVFDQIMHQVEYQKSLGNLEGMSDLQAYEAVGTAMVRAAEQANLKKNDSQESSSSDQTAVSDEAKQAKQNLLNDQRRAAGLPKSSNNAAPVTKEESVLDLSDEEFLKQHNGGIR